MAFDEQLKRVLDAALAELTEAARADVERARTEGIEAGRAQGWEDGREQGRFEGQEAARHEADARFAVLTQEAEARHAAALHEASARAATGTSVLDSLLDGFRAIDRARSLSEILDTVAACAGREAPRAAVLLTREGRLRGWRFVGFERSISAESVDAPVAGTGVIEEAIEKHVATGSTMIPACIPPGEGCTFAQPLDIAGSVVAVLYADGLDDQGRIDGVERRLEALGRHASRALEAMTALKAARAAVQAADGGAPAASASDDADSSAKRYARLLVSEIKLYHEPAIVAGRRDRDLATRLGGEIARARTLYEERVPESIRTRTDYFRDELVRTLANGDATLLQAT